MRKECPQEVRKQGLKAGSGDKGSECSIPIAKGLEVQSRLLQVESGF